MSEAVRGLDTYPKPLLAVDPALLTVEGDSLWTVLWRRQYPPQKGSWALPGVFVNESEDLESAVRRALRDKANLSRLSHVEQLFTWNKPGRDPRGWVVTVAYFALLSHESVRAAVAGQNNVGLFRIQTYGDDECPGPVVSPDGRPMRLAFDHAEIIRLVVMRLREKLWHTPVALALLPDRFTLREMQLVYEAILGQRLNKDSFRRRVTKTQRIVTPTGDLQTDVDHRPAELFTRTLDSG